LLDEADAEKAASELVRLALHRGGIDNVTVVVLDVLAGETPAVSDDVVVIPVALSGAPVQASGAITEAVALTAAVGVAASSRPAGQPSSPAGQPVVAKGSLTVPMTTAPPQVLEVPSFRAVTRASRPMVLVKAKGRKEHRDRIFTIRVALFVLVFAAILGSTAGVVVWFDKASFYVGLDRGYVTIFQGRPGGLLWLEPSVVERTTITPSDLLSSNVVYLKQGMEESSYQAARNLVRSLSLERTVIIPSESTTTTTVLATTTTTVPKR
jgi:protein phosphatase